MQKQLQIFNRAVDMFMEDKNIYLQYKDFDEALEPERNRESPDLYEYEGVDYKIDDYWPDRDTIHPDKLNFEYYEIPNFDGMPYIPPPFREKYEICLWRLDTKGVCKIKNSYFTPEIAEYDAPDFGGFEVEMALDHQTMILVENISKNEESVKQKLRTVLIFDFYTLDKIVEFQVDTINATYLERDEYNKDNDLINPQFNTE